MTTLALTVSRTARSVVERGMEHTGTTAVFATSTRTSLSPTTARTNAPSCKPVLLAVESSCLMRQLESDVYHDFKGLLNVFVLYFFFVFHHFIDFAAYPLKFL